MVPPLLQTEAYASQLYEALPVVESDPIPRVLPELISAGLG
jgi:hypothetical protein